MKLLLHLSRDPKIYETRKGRIERRMKFSRIMESQHCS
jgi:hypothetical protein